MVWNKSGNLRDKSRGVSQTTQLRSWRAAIGQRNVQPVDILVTGHSIAEGYYAPTLAKRWIQILLNRLHGSFGPGGKDSGIYHPTIMGAGMGPGWTNPWTLVGANSAVADYGNFGFGLGRKYFYMGANDTATYRFKGDRVWLLFTGGNGVGGAKISIDGAEFARFDTYRTAGANTQSGIKWDSGYLRHNGYHTLTVQSVVYGASANNVLDLEGAIHFDGEHDQGVRIWDSAHAGHKASDHVLGTKVGWSGAIQNGSGGVGVPTVSPKLCIVQFGTNEYGQGIDVATFKTNLGNHLTVLAGATTSILLVVDWAGAGNLSSGQPRTEAGWLPYRQAIYDLADERNAAVADLYLLAGFIGADPYAFTTDFVHPNERGSFAIADFMCDILEIPKVAEKVAPALPTQALGAASKVVYSGHSLSAAGGVSMPDRSFSNILSSMLRAVDTNIARGGAVLGWANDQDAPWSTYPMPRAATTGDGGWATFLNNVPVINRPFTHRGAWGAAVNYAINDVVYTGGAVLAARWWYSKTANVNIDPIADNGTNWVEITTYNQRGVSGYEPMPQLHVVNYGLNDLGWGKDYAKFERALRLICARIISGMFIPDNHPLITVTGTGMGVTVYGGGTVSDGLTYRNLAGTAVVGDTMLCMIPADFPGGTIRYHFFQAPPTAGQTGKVMLTLDGVDVREIDFKTDRVYAYGIATQRFLEWTEALPNVAAGKHTVGFRITEVFTVNGNFDGITIDSPNPPPFVVVGLHKPITYASYTAPLPVDADVTTWNANIAAMLTAEFPTALFVEPTAISDKDVKKFYFDGLHPNDLGHRLMAQQIYDAIISSQSFVSSATAMLTSTEPRIGNIWFGKYGDNKNAVANVAIPTGAVWTDIVVGTKTLEATVVAQPGDVLEIVLVGLWNNAPTGVYGYADFAVVGPAVAGGAQKTNYVSSAASAPLTNGVTLAGTGVFAPLCPTPQHYVVQASDLVNGTITIRAIAKVAFSGTGNDGARNILTGAGTSLDFAVKNIGPMDSLRVGAAL